jgi:hypothetical protein
MRYALTLVVLLIASEAFAQYNTRLPTFYYRPTYAQRKRAERAQAQYMEEVQRRQEADAQWVAQHPYEAHLQRMEDLQYQQMREMKNQTFLMRTQEWNLTPDGHGGYRASQW